MHMSSKVRAKSGKSSLYSAPSTKKVRTSTGSGQAARITFIVVRAAASELFSYLFPERAFASPLISSDDAFHSRAHLDYSVMTNIILFMYFLLFLFAIDVLEKPVFRFESFVVFSLFEVFSLFFRERRISPFFRFFKKICDFVQSIRNSVCRDTWSVLLWRN